MCDTVVALGDATVDGAVLFAKNSDRDPNEAHMLVAIPGAHHLAGSVTSCTYMDIPQVAATYAVLLAKPFWIWGAEMGANEQGVVIGNEAVFTRLPKEEGPGLIGMDFIRLALERAPTARAAVDVITELLETHGQGGNCGFTRPFFYHNSYLIADPHEAWVLETAGRAWVAERVISIRSISNSLTIGSTWDLASDGLVELAVEHGWCKDAADFDFARCYGDPDYASLPGAQGRHSCSTALLQQARGRISAATMMDLLRDHSSSCDDPDWTPLDGEFRADLCMHTGPGDLRRSQTTGSMVSHLKPELQTHWLTGTSAPCTSIFKPVWLDAGLPATGTQPRGCYDATTLWWRHEALHRGVLRDYSARLASYQSERDALETSFVQAAHDYQTASAAERHELSTRCFTVAGEALDSWTDQAGRLSPQASTTADFDLVWHDLNQQAQMPE